MKIITLWQPWATFVALSLKSIETRSWPTSYRGKLAIHAAKRPLTDADKRTYSEAIAIAHRLGVCPPPVKVPFPEQLPLGCIVAIADLTDCTQMTEDLIQAQSELELAVGDWQVGRYAWHLKDTVALEPIAYKGGQGLRNLDEEVLGAIAAQLLPF